MITFVLSAALLVGALCLGAALEGVTTEAPAGGCRIACPGRRTAPTITTPVALSNCRCEPITSKARPVSEKPMH